MYDKLDLKIKDIKNKVPDTNTLSNKRQCNTDKQNLEKDIEDVDEKISKNNNLVTKLNLTKDVRN